MCEFQDPHSGKTIDNAKEHEGLYMFEDEISICGQARVGSLDVFNTKDDEIMLWHLRLGHTSFQYLKHHHAHFPSRLYIPSKPFSLIHSDLLGPSKIPAMTGKNGLLLLWMIILEFVGSIFCQKKSKARKTFKVFHSMIKTQYQTNIQVFRSNNGQKYFNSLLSGYFTKKGFIHQSSYPNTPQ